MFTTIYRRSLAACASVLLTLGLVAVTTSPAPAADGDQLVKGSVTTQGYYGIADVAVRLYRASDSEENPWVLQATVYSTGTDYGQGQFQANVPAGTYRATINELDDGGTAWDVWTPLNWQDTSSNSEFVVADQSRWLGVTKLSYRGGLITGSTKDQCGERINAAVTAFSASDTTPQASLTALTDHGEFSIHALGGPTKLRFSRSGSEDSWYKGAGTFETATPITVVTGGTSSGNDVVVKRILETSGPLRNFSGYVSSDGGGSIENAAVRIYHTIGDGSVLGALQATAYTDERGWFSIALPVGSYRVTYNELDDGGSVWDQYSPGNKNAGSSQFCIEGGGSAFGTPDARLTYRGDPITGRVVDVNGSPVREVTIEAFDANNPSAAAFVTYTNSNGEFKTRGTYALTKLRFSATAFVPEWFDNASASDTSSTIDASAGDVAIDQDIVLTNRPIFATFRPEIYGVPKVGAYLTSEALFYPAGVTLSYQWFNKVGSKSRAISGAKAYRYKLRESDLGKRIWLRVTGHPPAGYPIAANVSADTGMSGAVKRSSSLSASHKTSAGKVSVSIKVKITGIKKPHGKVTVRYGKRSSNGYSISFSGKVTKKPVSFKNGKAKFSFKTRSTALYMYEVTYAGSSTVSSSKVRRFS